MELLMLAAIAGFCMCALGAIIALLYLAEYSMKYFGKGAKSVKKNVKKYCTDHVKNYYAYHYVGEAVMFSGRKNPAWEVNVNTGMKLEDIWHSLTVTFESTPPPSPLGYQGCTLKRKGKHWWTADGVVILGKETRKDPARRFEKTLLASAPEGSLPPSLLPN